MSERTGSGDTVAAALSAVGRVVSRVVTAAFVAGYLALWLGLAGFHYANGDPMQAAVTVVVFVLPFVGLLLWQVVRASDVDAGDVGADAIPTSS